MDMVYAIIDDHGVHYLNGVHYLELVFPETLGSFHIRHTFRRKANSSITLVCIN